MSDLGWLLSAHRSTILNQPRLRSLNWSTSPPSRMAQSAYVARSATERWLGVGSATATFDCIACGIWAETCLIAAIVEAPDGDSAYSSKPLRLSRRVFSNASRTCVPRWLWQARALLPTNSVDVILCSSHGTCQLGLSPYRQASKP